jgi:transcriptional regulator with XRE-family HTH domain
MPLKPATSRLARTAHRTIVDLKRAIGAEIRRAREDAGITQRKLATAAGISQAHLCAIEAGETEPTLEVLGRIAAALGGRLKVQIEPGAGPPIRDHLQARMIEELLRVTHRRWRRFTEVPVFRPARGFIDVALHEPNEGVLVSTEVHSLLRRLEQQIRWAQVKTDALPTSDFVSGLGQHLAPRRYSRLLVLRSSRETREVAATYEHLLRAAYPARAPEAVASLTGDAPWPGETIVWMSMEGPSTHLMDRPPRGVALGR